MSDCKGSMDLMVPVDDCVEKKTNICLRPTQHGWLEKISTPFPPLSILISCLPYFYTLTLNFLLLFLSLISRFRIILSSTSISRRRCSASSSCRRRTREGNTTSFTVSTLWWVGGEELMQTKFNILTTPPPSHKEKSLNVQHKQYGHETKHCTLCQAVKLTS